MSKNVYKLRSEVWLYPGMAGWHFISVPKKESEEIKQVARRSPPQGARYSRATPWLFFLEAESTTADSRLNASPRQSHEALHPNKKEIRCSDERLGFAPCGRDHQKDKLENFNISG